MFLEETGFYPLPPALLPLGGKVPSESPGYLGPIDNQDA